MIVVYPEKKSIKVNTFAIRDPFHTEGLRFNLINTILNQHHPQSTPSSINTILNQHHSSTIITGPSLSRPSLTHCDLKLIQQGPGCLATLRVCPRGLSVV
jgi:hypothetical protein